MNPNQPALIAAAIAKMGQGSRVVIATDNDPGGHQIAAQIEAIAAESGQEDLAVIPEQPGIGTRIEGRDDRELAVPFGKRAYVPRYRLHEDTIVILRIWHGRGERD
jgi:plasmid stabilization system protein ParE